MEVREMAVNRIHETYKGIPLRVSEYQDYEGTYFEGVADGIGETENTFFKTPLSCLQALRELVDADLSSTN